MFYDSEICSSEAPICCIYQVIFFLLFEENYLQKVFLFFLHTTSVHPADHSSGKHVHVMSAFYTCIAKLGYAGVYLFFLFLS